MSYSNPLHAPLRPSHQSSFSSIGGAVQGAYSTPPLNTPFINPSRKRVPQDSYAVSRQLGRPVTTAGPVYFDFYPHVIEDATSKFQRDKPCSHQGMPMRELVVRGAHALGSIMSGADDAVFYQSGLKRITLRILWPGYSHVEWASTIELHTPHGLITRAQLGATIASHFARFIEKNQNVPNRAGDWRVGPSGIRFQNLILVALWNVYGDNWQADVAVDFS